MSVLLVDRVTGKEGKDEVKGVRFEPVHVPITVANLEIGYQSLSQVSVDDFCVPGPLRGDVDCGFGSGAYVSLTGGL